MLRSRVLAGFAVCLFAAAAFAVVPTDENDPLRQKAFQHPDLWWESIYRPVAELPVDLSRQLGSDLAALGADPANVYFDARTGRWGTVIVTQPLIPGSGVGNTLQWSNLGRPAPADAAEREQAVWDAFRRYLVDHVARLRIDPAELATPRVTAMGERLIQIHVGRQIDGVPVRDAFVKATVNSGNLVLLGQRSWGGSLVDTRPRISAEAATEAVRQYLDGIAVSGFFKAPRLELVPVSSQREEAAVELGAGLEHRLVWALRPTFGDEHDNWEALVDAASGEVLSFQDLDHYASRRVEGWVFPVSNDGEGDDGTLQPGFPMPFADLALDGEPLGVTSTGGNVPPGADTGTISTKLAGPFVAMNDACGAIDESAASGDLDLEGVPLPGTDCQVPPGHSPGDTNASRSGFYELNRLKEQARGYLPDNGWLQQQLTANMNINLNCNAFWNGSTVNFYTSGGGCRNTGEIAAIFDHEWGHGMDNNDGNPTISRPGEGIADIYAINRLNDSCVGRGFRFTNCTGYGDACLDCTGVREVDWDKHASHTPHGVSWILSNCSGGTGTPCGRGTHCEGHVVSESAWDLVHRDLRGFDGSPFNLDLNTALEVGTRLGYYGSSNVFNWYQCVTDGTGGCNPDSGYLGYLAADDDNGDLTDGTPHMSAIFAAFDRHQIACPTPTVQDAGCAGGPATAPANLTATPINEGAHLSWDPVAGASEYRIFRTEGVNGCDFGKAPVGTTTSTQFVEAGLRNDFEVLYSVVAVGDNEACASPMSACEAVTPELGPGLGFAATPLAGVPQTGDGDGFFDNCEIWDLTFQVGNTGAGDLTNVRIVGASIASHPEAQILTTLPSTIAAVLAEGASADGVLAVRGGGFAFNDTLELEVEVTADELAPLTFTRTYTLAALESDLELQPSVTFSFEDGDDGWELVSGVSDRTDAVPGGANGTDFYRASSSNVNLTCDRIRSPLLQLSATSALEAYNQFNIEAFSGGFWWDRANVGVYDPATGERTVVAPDSGRTYNASGTNPAPAPCASDDPPGQPGWAGVGADWQTSGWTAGALGSPDLAGQLIQLDVAYGTDPAETGTFGFWFDEVTVTDVQLQVPDGQSDTCEGVPQIAFEPTGLQADPTATTLSDGNGVFEPGELVVVAPEWRNDGLVAGALTGTASDFTGPAGATYTVMEDGADYGNVAAGETASCLDGGGCYELGLSDPAVRPATLWEATFDETLDDPDGSTKTWTLHIGDSFTDVPRSSPFYTAIETLLGSGVTGGCGAGDAYCPGSANTRAQMPVFMLRALLGADYTPPACVEGNDPFGDVPFDSTFCRWIQDLANRGIVSGCGDGDYCPGNPVTRAQMSIFLLKTLLGADYTPPECSNQFTDVPCPSLFADWIEDLAARGITSGCTASEYCPGAAVTRAQMAVFITRAFGFTLYGP